MAKRKNAVVDTEEVSVHRVSLVCSSCGGGLSVDEDSSVLMCPFCGAKELIVQSEAVEIEKIRSESLKEIELERIRSAERIKLKEHKQRSDQKELEEIDKFKKSVKSKLLIAGFVITMVFAFLFFVTSCVISGILAVAQSACFGVAWAMGMRILKGAGKHLHSIFVALAVILILPVIIMIDTKIEFVPENDWNLIFLNDAIPEPASKRFEIHKNTDSELWLDIHNISEEDYYKFLSECKDMGYTNEITEVSRSYKAYNDGGYCIDVSYLRSYAEMSLRVDKPADLYELNWKEHTVSKALPEPPSTVGLYKQENDEKTEMIVGDITKEEYIAYCDSCRKLGFTIEESGYEYTYSAFSEEGYELSLSYTVGSRQLAITLKYPLAFTDIAWPENGIGSMLPVPSSLSAKVESNHNSSYSVYVDNMPRAEYESYVQKCIDAGFNKGISKYDSSFSASNSTGEDIWVNYKGNEVVYISVSGSYNKDYYN